MSVDLLVEKIKSKGNPSVAGLDPKLDYAKEITALIDSLYQLQPLLIPQSCGTFVFPDDFAEISYFEKQVTYEDSVYYYVEDEGDCIDVKTPDGYLIVPRLKFTQDSIGELSPKVVKTFIKRLEKRNSK